MKTIWISLLVLIVIGIVLSCTQRYSGTDYKNATYSIDDRSVTLVNGSSEIATTPGSVSKIVTKYFGNETFGDLNGDGLPDVGFILTQTNGGSGTFYYAAVALKTRNGYSGINAVFLGDRIAPQTTKINSGQLIVNYADRMRNEPMTATPSVGVSKYLEVLDNRLAVVK